MPFRAFLQKKNKYFSVFIREFEYVSLVPEVDCPPAVHEYEDVCDVGGHVAQREEGDDSLYPAALALMAKETVDTL